MSMLIIWKLDHLDLKKLQVGFSMNCLPFADHTHFGYVKANQSY